MSSVQALVVGSQALRVAGFIWREPADVDVIAEPETARSIAGFMEILGAQVRYTRGAFRTPGLPTSPRFSPPFIPTEIEVAWPGTTAAALLDLANSPDARRDIVIPGRSFAWYGEPMMHVAQPGVVLALKLSHRFMKDSAHFEKTRYDILALQARCEVPEVLREWVKRREKETLGEHKSPVLAVPKKEFFTDNVPYKYVHDTLHLAVAWGEDGQPAYTKFQRDGAEVMVDREKWEALPQEVKLNSVVEEAAVLALERHQIPNDFRPEPFRSYLIALQKVCTTISSGWWREWAWEHYDEAKARGQRWDYVRCFREGLARGIVKEV